MTTAQRWYMAWLFKHAGVSQHTVAATAVQQHRTTISETEFCRERFDEHDAYGIYICIYIYESFSYVCIFMFHVCTCVFTFMQM